MGKKELRVFLLVRPDGRTSPPSLSALAPSLPDAGVNWILPSCVFSGAQAPAWLSFLDDLDGQRPGDCVVSAGFAGAPHPLLQIEELRREVEWGLRAPGDPDRRFRPLAGLLAPGAADFLRPEALWLYATKGVRRLVVPAPGEWSIGAQIPVEGLPLQVLYRHEAREVAALPTARLLARTDGNLCVCADASQASAIRGLLRGLSARTRMTFARLDQPMDLPQGGAESLPAAGSDPALRDRAASVSAFRAHREGSEETSSVLQVMAGLHTVAGPARSVDVFPAARRENTAVMMGSVTLSDGALSAHFESGRLNSLSWNNRSVTPAAACRSYAGSAKQRPFDVTAAYALEAERLRGLRTLCRLSGDPSTLVVEYFFVEDCHYLLVSGRVRYPARRGLEAVAPLEMAVARVPAGGVAVRVLCRGEASYAIPITERTGPLCLSGSLFWFEGTEGGLVAGFPPVKEPALESVWLRVRRVGSENLLFASFFRNPGSSQSFAGRDELFSLYLGVAFEAPQALPGFPRAVLDELPHHALSS